MVLIDNENENVYPMVRSGSATHEYELSDELKVSTILLIKIILQLLRSTGAHDRE